MNAYPAILIVAPAWVGDMVMAQSLFELLKRRRPDSMIDILAPPWTAPLTLHMQEVRETVILPVGHGVLKLRTRYRIGKTLRRHHYQQAIVLPNSFKSALIPYWAKIPLRTGYVGEFRYPLLNDCRPLNKAMLRRTVDRFVELGEPRDVPPPTYVPKPRLIASEHRAQQALERLKLAAPTQPVLALCPGAEYGPAKQWPARHFAAVATHYLAQGWAVWLFGSAKDIAIAAAVNADAKHGCVNLCGLTSLNEAVDLLALSQAVVTNDSGLMHVAAALGLPVVAVYGSSDPGFTPPLSDKARIVSLELPCSPCFKRKCPLRHLQCLNDLKPDRVIEVLGQKPR